ncbi:hypothetical protein, partial [Acinetobacter baumannii]|uniref:hypothetical protein n=1 Tax=Acinetobacter baumannii TaxID=470 RepID=UPI0018E08E4C
RVSVSRLAIFGQPIPNDIFKYRSITSSEQRDWLAQTLIGHTFYFALPGEFNDPYDCMPLYQAPHGDALERVVQRVMDRDFGHLEGEAREQQAEALRATTDEEYAERFPIIQSAMHETGIHSLSGDPANMLLWS